MAQEPVEVEVLAVRGSMVDLRVEGSDMTVNLMPGDTLVLRGGGAWTLRHDWLREAITPSLPTHPGLPPRRDVPGG